MADFDPVKKDDVKHRVQKIIWTTKSIERAADAMSKGQPLIASPFLNGNIKLLKPDLVYKRTPEEIEEWTRCKDDLIYFVEKYCKIMTPQGIRPIVLRDYQRRYLECLRDHNLTIYLAARQVGKSVVTGIFLLHFLLFNIDKLALIAADKFKTAKEIMEKFKLVYLELPYFLKCGVLKDNVSEISLDNGSRLLAEATTVKTGIGLTIHMLLLDEFAHLPANVMEKFYGNIFPTIVASNARCAITSTQNGYNLFYRLYMAAESGENAYTPFKTDWYEVPEWNPELKCWEKRDEKWHRRQVANYGSEEAFNRQFGTNFDINANTLISQKILSKRRDETVAFINKDLPGVVHWDSWWWHPDYDPTSSLKRDYLIITCDLAEGGGGDYTVFSIHRMCVRGSGRLECVGYFRSNIIVREQCALSLGLLCSIYCDGDKLIISHEKNTYGDLFVKDMQELMESNQTIQNGFAWECMLKYWSEKGRTYTLGLKITPGNKTNLCLLYKEDYERDLIRNEAAQYMIELGNFTDSGGTGHYSASFGHDDMVMTSVQLEGVKGTLRYKTLRAEFDEGARPNDQAPDFYSSDPLTYMQANGGMIGGDIWSAGAQPINNIPFQGTSGMIISNESRLHKF